jgi:hypothetical protein
MGLRNTRVQRDVISKDELDVIDDAVYRSVVTREGQPNRGVVNSHHCKRIGGAYEKGGNFALIVLRARTAFTHLGKRDGVLANSAEGV